MSHSDFFGKRGASRHSDLTMPELEEYYRGAQPLSFLHPEVAERVDGRLRSLVINLPRLVVDSIEDRLDVEGFRLADGPDDELWRIWQANDLDEWSQLAHLDSLILARSFALVWPNPDDPATPLVTVESARQMRVEYDASRKRILSATKTWSEDGRDFCTMYDPNWIVRYENAAESKAEPDWRPREEPIENVMGVVPVVLFPNRPSLLRPQGESEMTDVIPITDALNKLATDMMTSAEYHAMPRRWATGIDMGGNVTEERVREKVKQRWSDATAGRVWLAEKNDVTFGQFPEASLDAYVSASNMLTQRASAITGLPPHYFGLAGENPASAEALRAAEAVLVERVKRKHRVLGGCWERVMRLAMLAREGEMPAGMESLETIWRDPETPTVAQKADAAVKLHAEGIVPTGQIREDLGYTPLQIERMEAEPVPQAPPAP